MDDDIVLVLTCDRNFLRYAAVCAVSAIRKTQRKILLYLLTDDSVTEKDKKTFTGIFTQFENVKEVKVLDISGKVSFRDSGTAKYPKIVYYRMFIPLLFEKENFQRCIYLDTDTTILSDIGELFDTDLEGKLLGVCRCPVMAEKIRKKVLLPNGKYADEYVKSLIRDPENYFISACILYNLAEIRKNGMAPVHKVMQMDGTNFFCPDQDILNTAYEGNVKFLSPSWCCTPADTEGAALPEAKILHTKMWSGHLHLSDDVWFRDLKFTPYYYSVRAEYLALLFERSINNVLRPVSDGLLKSLFCFSMHFIFALLKRVISWKKGK